MRVGSPSAGRPVLCNNPCVRRRAGTNPHDASNDAVGSHFTHAATDGGEPFAALLVFARDGPTLAFKYLYLAGTFSPRRPDVADLRLS